MKLRISNLKNYAVEFVASSESEFRIAAMLAAREFRQHENRPVHRGETRQNVVWCNRGMLGIYSEQSNTWYNPGEIKTTDNDLTFYEPRETEILPWREAASLDDALMQDEFGIIANISIMWKLCSDTFRWGLALDNLVSDVSDQLQEES